MSRQGMEGGLPAVTIAVTGTGSDAALRSLWAFLREEDELRGRVSLAQRPPPPGTLGPTGDALLVALGPGGVATALASVLIAWIRRRTGDETIRIVRPDGTEIELTAQRVRGLRAEELHRLAVELHASLTPGASPVAAEEGPGPDA